MSAKGRLVNMGDLSHLWGVALNTVKAWVRRGCPVVARGGRGREWQFDTAAVAQWREEQAAAAAVGDTSAIDLEEARRRKEAALAAMAELDLAKRRGEVVEIEAIADIVGEEYTRLRARLLAIPVKLAPLMEAASNLAERREIISSAISECLAELSADDDYATGRGEGEAGEATASAQADCI